MEEAGLRTIEHHIDAGGRPSRTVNCCMAGASHLPRRKGELSGQEQRARARQTQATLTLLSHSQ
eukprot:scaffold15261_cov89-Skeletonema_dohrnii-CCMP3373.AAC.1